MNRRNQNGRLNFQTFYHITVEWKLTRNVTRCGISIRLVRIVENKENERACPPGAEPVGEVKEGAMF